MQIDAFISSDTLTVSSYEWQFDNSFFENVPSFTHLVESAGIYELCLNVQSNCNASIFCQDITVLTPAICEGDDTWLYHISGNQINDIAESINDFWIASDGGLSVWHKIDGSVNTYTSYNSGLTDNQVNTVAVAPNNDKWIGTQNGGLLLFRNGTWHTYHTTNSNLPSQTVYDIKIDANGAKWVATTNGLLRINGGIWRVFNTSNSNLPSNMIQCLEINANGDMWIGSDNGLFFYDKQNQISTTYTYENDALQSNNIQTLAIDNDNIIWIGYKNGGLDILEETNVTNHNDKLPNQYVKDILIDAENTKWIATKSGILQFDNENWSLFNSENSAFNHNTINSLLLANSGAKWIGTEDGIYSYMNENWQAFDATTAVLPHNETTAIAIDDSQNIWTTSVAGLIQHTNGEWIIHNQETVPNLESQHFTSIAIDENNVKWIASFDKGLFRFDGENWANFSTENSNLTSNHIFQVEANNNDIWLTQSDKLVYFDGVNFLNFDFEMSIEPTALMVDELQNRVWIGTKNNGLIAFHNDNGFSYYYEYNSLISDNQINSLLLQNEKLWIATQSGLFTYENETWNVPNTDNDLLNNDIINILTKDAQGRLVAISQHYVYLQKNNLWESYAIPQSASFSQNLDAVVDEDLKIWLATTRGIAIQARSAEANAFFEITNTETCENYTIDCVNKSIGANRFEWFINGVLASEDADLIYEFTQAGNYNISLIAINESGCEDVFSQEINVYSNAHLVSLPDQIAVCIEDDNPIIEATATDMTSYEWRRNGVLISNEYFCEATQQGRYELFITDNCGNEKMLETHIYIDNDCVWPGDLNNDQIVNHHDLLALSLTIGQYGQQRPNANSNWQGQPSFDWGVIAANTNDLKHIDANGNGVIDLSDIQMIDFHYGKTHHNQSVNIPPDLSSDVNFRANLTTPPTATNNKTMEINLEVTHKNDIDIHAYGIAFDIEYALPAGLNMNHIDLDFSDSWLNVNENDVQTIYRHFPEQNKIEVAITRIDHQNASNTGIMAKLRAEVDVVPSGTSSIMVMNIHNILFINNEGLQIPIATSQNSLNILPENESAKNTSSSFDAVNIYPNPANDYVSIVFEHEMKNMQIALYNMQGKHFVPKVSKQANNTFLLHVSDIPTGLYQLVAFTEKKRWHTSKLMIYR